MKKTCLFKTDIPREIVNEKAEMLISSKPTILEIAMTKALIDAHDQLVALTSEDDVPTSVTQILKLLGEI